MMKIKKNTEAIFSEWDIFGLWNVIISELKQCRRDSRKKTFPSFRKEPKSFEYIGFESQPVIALSLVRSEKK